LPSSPDAPTHSKGRLSILGAAPGARVEAISADVSTAAGCYDAMSRAVGALGGIDILVNNAGQSAAGPFLSHTDDRIQQDLDLKLFHAIRMSRLAIPHMREAGGGRIVNVAAIQGKTPGAGTVPTSLARAAGLALTKALSKEFAPTTSS
jgi:NAD(P)-dependent dehydrogenase (short-subunit alcohol dehydrogenase family)